MVSLSVTVMPRSARGTGRSKKGGAKRTRLKEQIREPPAQRHSDAATARFAGLDRRLAALAEAGPQAFLAVRTRAMVLLVRDALVYHGAYFDAGEPADGLRYGQGRIN